MTRLTVYDSYDDKRWVEATEHGRCALIKTVQVECSGELHVIYIALKTGALGHLINRLTEIKNSIDGKGE